MRQRDGSLAPRSNPVRKVVSIHNPKPRLDIRNGMGMCVMPGPLGAGFVGLGGGVFAPPLPPFFAPPADPAFLRPALVVPAAVLNPRLAFAEADELLVGPERERDAGQIERPHGRVGPMVGEPRRD